MIGARPVVIAVAAELVATTLVLAWYWHRQRTTPTTYSEVSKITSRRLRIYRSTVASVYLTLIVWFHATEPDASVEDGLPESFTAWNSHLQALWWVLAAAAPRSEFTHIVLETVLPSAWFVTAIVALVLAPLSPAIFVSFEHFWNSVAISLDVRWNEFVVRRHHALLPCLWAITYLLRSWARRAAAGDSFVWSYEFLALNDGSALMWYSLLVVVNVGVYQACARATERKLPRTRAGESESRATPQVADDGGELGGVELETLLDRGLVP